MPTIIDSLVVELGFDTAGMKAGRVEITDIFKKLRDEVKKTGKDTEDSSKKSSEYLTRLRNNVLALYAAFTAGRGLKEFVSDMTTSNATIGRFAKSIGESVQDIAGWRAAGRQMGVSAEDIDGTFSGLTQQFQQFALTGDSTVVPWFRSLGMSISDANGKMIPVEQTLLTLSERLQGMDKAKATTFLQNMGIPQGMIYMIEKGPAAMQRMIDKEKALKEAIAADADAAAERQEAWNDFLNSAETIGTILLTQFTTALKAVANGLKALSDWAVANPGKMEAIFVALTTVVSILSAAITIGLVKGALGLASAAITGLAATLGIASAPLWGIVAAITAISVAAYELYNHWGHLGEWADNLVTGGKAHPDGDGGINKKKPNAKSSEGQKGASVGSTPANDNDTSSNRKGGYSDRSLADLDVKKLQAMGWTKEQAQGIVANIAAESSGKEDNVGDHGSAFGLAQWHPDRQRDFEAWAGHSIKTASRDEQLAFINYELRKGSRKVAGAALAGQSTATGAADVVSRLYEAPKDAAGASATRQAIAAAMNRAPPSAVALGGQAGRIATASKGQGGSVSTSEVNIREMHINTKATDAKGIARDFGDAVKRNQFAQQANSGPA